MKEGFNHEQSMQNLRDEQRVEQSGWSPIESNSTNFEDSQEPPSITQLSPENRKKLVKGSIDPKLLNDLKIENIPSKEEDSKITSLRSKPMSTKTGVYISKEIEELFYRFLFRGVRGVVMVIIGFAFLFWVIRKKRRDSITKQYELKKLREQQHSRDAEQRLLDEMRSVGYDVDDE